MEPQGALVLTAAVILLSSLRLLLLLLLSSALTLFFCHFLQVQAAIPAALLHGASGRFGTA